MKKTLSVLLSIVMIISAVNLSPFSALIAFGEEDSDFEGSFMTGNTSYSYSASTKHLVIEGLASDSFIPDFDDSSNKSPLYDCQAETVEISSITSVGNYAFAQCTQLGSITIPAGTTSIGNNAFEGCSALVTITIPDSIANIGSSAFRNCSALTEFMIPDSAPIDTIKYQTFKGCTSLSEVTIYTSGITAIEDEAFSACSNLPSILFGDSLESIGIGAFQSCTSLSGIYLPESFNSLGAGAFYGCTSLGYFGIAENAPISEIPQQAFEGCSSLVTVSLNNNMLEIGDGAFYSCINLSDVSLGSELQNIRSSAFQNCSAIQALTLPDTLFGIEAAAFEGCTSLLEFEAPEALTIIPEEAFSGCSSLNRVVLHEGISEIGSGAFSDCTALTSISLYDGITLYSNVFSGCTALEKVYMGKSAMIMTEAFVGFDGDIYYKGNAEEWTFCIGDGGEPEDDRNIGIDSPRENSRIHFDYLEPSGSYGANVSDVFDEGTGTLTFTGSGEARSPHEEYRFRGNHAIREVVFGDGITEAEEEMFENCANLSSITIPSGFTYLPGSFLCGCYSLTSIDLPDSIESIGYSSLNGTGIESFDFPASVTAIEEGAFSGCFDLTEITIPAAIDSIPDSAFMGSGLVKIEIPDTVEVIGNSAFSGCYDLESVDLGNGVETIGNNAFYNCVNLREVHIPASVSEIGTTAFGYAENTVITEYFPELEQDFEVIYWIYRCKDFKIYANCNATDAVDAYLAACRDYEAGMGYPDMPHFFIRELVHDWEMPTCTDDGICNYCKQTVPCEGHKPVTDPAREATYTEEGLTEGSHCSVCGEILVAQNTIPRLQFVDSSDNVDASYHEVSGTLTLTGEGEIPNSGEGAVFEGNADIKKVVIGEGITSIGENIFKNCSNLNTVVLPDSLNEINSGAFEGCSSLKTIDVPENVQKIEEKAFSSTGLTNITIPGSVEQLGDSAFEGCVGLKTVNLVDGIDMIDDCVFVNCPQLTSVYIPEAVSNIGALSFGYVSTDYLTPEQLKSVQNLGYDMNDGTMAKLKNFIFYTDCSEDITAVESYIINSKFLEEELGIEGSPDISILLLHNNLTEKSRVAATCGKDGRITYTCGCGKKIKETVIPATGKHTFDTGIVAREASCNAPGFKTFTCKTCGATKTQTIARLKHNYTANVIAPTCTQKGYTVHTCTKCHASYNDAFKNAKGHSWDGGEITKAPTYKAKGEKTFVCKTCGASRKEPVPVLKKNENPIAVKAKSAYNISLKKLQKKDIRVSFDKLAEVKNSEGKLSYKITKVSDKKAKSQIKINKNTGEITLNKKLRKGSYKVTVTVTAAGTDEFKSKTKKVIIKITVKE